MKAAWKTEQWGFKIGTNLSEEIGDWFGGGITMEELEGTVLSSLTLGPEERLLSMGQGGREEQICEKSRREASAVACFRLPLCWMQHVRRPL